jgi:hypothetical protein
MAVDSDLCDEGGSGLLPDDIFLPEPEIIQAYRRLKMFKPDEFTMDGFRKAGCDAHLLNCIMDVVRNTSGKIKRLGFAAEMLPFNAHDAFVDPKFYAHDAFVDPNACRQL